MVPAREARALGLIHQPDQHARDEDPQYWYGHLPLGRHTILFVEGRVQQHLHGVAESTSQEAAQGGGGQGLDGQGQGIGRYGGELSQGRYEKNFGNSAWGWIGLIERV